MVRRIIDGDLKVTCPLCKAVAGSPCVSTGGHGPIAGGVHRERRQAVAAMLADFIEQFEKKIVEAGGGV